MQLFGENAPVAQKEATRLEVALLPQPKSDPRPVSFSSHQYRSIESALTKIFPTNKEVTRVQRARQILGNEVLELSDDDLDACLTEFQYLVDCWFDEYEKQAYGGKLLREIIKEV